MGITTYVLSKGVAARYKKQLRVETLLCYRCGKPITPEQEVIARRHTLFHRSCYEELYIEL